jgi:methyl-accepting chemotaxis protein
MRRRKARKDARGVSLNNLGHENIMNLINNLTVRGKLSFAFASVLLLMALLGGFATVQLSRVYGQTESILALRLAGVRDSLGMAEAASRLRAREYNLIVAKPEGVPAVLAKLDHSKAAFEAARVAYASAIADDTERGLYDKALEDWKHYQANTDKVVELVKGGNPDGARTQLLDSSHLFDAASNSIKELSKYNDTQAGDDARQAKALFQNSRMLVIALVVAAILIAISLGVIIARSIAIPLRKAVDLAQAVADGDLTRSVHTERRDEVGQLTRALGTMVGKLREVVGEVRRGVESVSTASTQIATGNIDLSQRTEEQASNLQQTAASMEELTSTVTQNAENARAAAQLALGATEVASRGGEVVSQVVTTMADITDSSKRIADIIGVIDGIAFQTNILALNAAVEAARAGEQGRGFAVVAGEVRNLAQRSAQAAKEIKGLIHQSVEKVDNGARLVGEAGRTMQDIVAQVKRVNDLVGEITSATVEQARGIEQVGQAVQQLDQVTQQNAALVEESAAAADSMQHQAGKLAQTVAVFNVGGEPQAVTPVVTAPKPKTRPVLARKAAPRLAATAVGEPEWSSF